MPYILNLSISFVIYDSKRNILRFYCRLLDRQKKNVDDIAMASEKLWMSFSCTISLKLQLIEK